MIKIITNHVKKMKNVNILGLFEEKCNKWFGTFWRKV